MSKTTHKSIVKLRYKTKFYSVIAYETTKQFFVCVILRYLTDTLEVEEAFLGFVELPKTDSQTISEV